MPRFPASLFAMLVALASSLAAQDAPVPLSTLRLAPLPEVVVRAAVPGGSMTLVVIGDNYRQVLIQRVTERGEAIDPVPIVAPPSQFVLWDGMQWRMIASGLDGVWMTSISPGGRMSEPVLHPGLRADAVAVVDGELAVARVQQGVSAVIDLFDTSSARISSVEIQLPPESLFVGLARVGSEWVAVASDPTRRPAHSKTYAVHGAAGRGAELPSGSRGLDQLTPHPRGGALLTWRDDEELYGAVLRADGSWTGPRHLGGSWLPNPITPTDSGWAILLETRDDLFRAIEVGFDLSVSPGAVFTADSRTLGEALSPGPAGDLLFLGGVGVRVLRAEGETFVEMPRIGVASARQHSPRLASAPRMSLALWNEAGWNGTTLRATRIDARGAPMDGEGILLSEDAVTGGHRTAFDGSAFVVVWTVRDGSFRLRRIPASGPVPIEGEIVPPWTPPTDRDEGWHVAGGEGGRALVTWSSDGSGYRSAIHAAIVENGTPREPHPIEDDNEFFRVVIEAAWNGEAWLVAWHAIFRCEVTCLPDPPAPLRGRILSPGGIPIGPRLEWVGNAVQASVAGAPGGWLMTWNGTLARVDAAGRIVSQTPAAAGLLDRDARLVSSAGTMWITPDGDLLQWTGAQQTDEHESLTTDGEMEIVRLHPDAPGLFVAPVRDAVWFADLALVETSRSQMRGWLTVDLRIEHRGGAPVRRIHLSGYGSDDVHLAIPQGLPRITDAAAWSVTIDRQLAAGEGIDIRVVMPISAEAAAVLSALPEAIDDHPENNAVAIEPVARGRAVKR